MLPGLPGCVPGSPLPRFHAHVEIAFGGFDEIRDQVIATLELDINLRKRVFESVAQSDQSVVDPHDPKGHQDDKDQQYAENGKQTCHYDSRNEGQKPLSDIKD